LRYGENSHQSAFLLRRNQQKDSLYDISLLHGKALSYNNMVDMYSAIDSVRDLPGKGCAVIKHNNPCGLASGPNQRQVFEMAWAGDPVSAFGSVIAFNQPVDEQTVRFLNLDAENKMERKFIEVIIAPSYSEEAEPYLFQHKNLRVVVYDPRRLKPEFDYKILHNALLLQTGDHTLMEKAEVVTEKKMEIKKELLEFGLIAVRQIRSNAIAVVRQREGGYVQLLGMGGGQPNRVNATELAMKRCTENLKLEFNGREEEREAYIAREMGRALLVSDAFFPFADNIEIAAQYGIKHIAQPGGSIRDKSVIRKCDELGLSMVFTGLRHFKH